MAPLVIFLKEGDGTYLMMMLDTGINYTSPSHSIPLSLVLRGCLQDAPALFSHAITFKRAKSLQGKAYNVQCYL